jgi:hypothetical protein
VKQLPLEQNEDLGIDGVAVVVVVGAAVGAAVLAVVNPMQLTNVADTSPVKFEFA